MFEIQGNGNASETCNETGAEMFFMGKVIISFKITSCRLWRATEVDVQ